MSLRPRPLSPHLQVYRWQLTAVLSILHRFTGIALFGGTLVWVIFLALLCWGPGAFEALKCVLNSFMGRVCLTGGLFSLYYHLFNGIRHLWWDSGRGFDLKTVYRTGWAVVGAAVVFTLLTLLWFLKEGGL